MYILLVGQTIIRIRSINFEERDFLFLYFIHVARFPFFFYFLLRTVQHLIDVILLLRAEVVQTKEGIGILSEVVIFYETSPPSMRKNFLSIRIYL